MSNSHEDPVSPRDDGEEAQFDCGSEQQRIGLKSTGSPMSAVMWVWAVHVVINWRRRAVSWSIYAWVAIKASVQRQAAAMLRRRERVQI
ncbi:hypothetical protein M0R45_015729 [Rubus argutus]|uniref:Uncharacterized protein n=1 Tax=Rubus argutus TaxID=59490 RepID=A0AAW1XQG0_RUBAR